MKSRTLLCALSWAAWIGTADATALSPLLSAMEGDWAENCTEAADEGFAVRYSLEFLRSGGSIEFDDGVDIWWRGTITAIHPVEKGFVFTYSTSRSKRPERLHATRLADGRLKLSKLGLGADSSLVILTQCAGPNHRVVAQLRWQQIAALTPSRSRFVYFVKPKRGGCKAAEDYLHFDLIGPAEYSIWRYGSQSASWKVERAVDDKGAARLTLKGDSGQTTISVGTPDAAHIRIEPWHETFLRCEE